MFFWCFIVYIESVEVDCSLRLGGYLGMELENAIV